MHVLAISGSLRARSSNGAVLDALALLAPPRATVERYEDVGALPHFNPDLDGPDGDRLPAVVRALRDAVGRADALAISSPEYAHGIPGAMKNVLDWLVASVEFPGKPVALLGASTLSVHAPAQLAEVLTTMSARLVSGACVALPLVGRRMDGVAIAGDAELAAMLQGALAAVEATVDETRA